MKKKNGIDKRYVQIKSRFKYRERHEFTNRECKDRFIDYLSSIFYENGLSA